MLVGGAWVASPLQRILWGCAPERAVSLWSAKTARGQVLQQLKVRGGGLRDDVIGRHDAHTLIDWPAAQGPLPWIAERTQES